MKKLLSAALLCIILLGACSPANPAPIQPPTATVTVPVEQPTTTNTPLPPSATVEPTETLTPTVTLTPTPVFPAEGRGPEDFETGINPLTGLPAASPRLLERRPIVIKVENLPRIHRPQWGLSLADLVYEYYTEQGTTRFSAVFYGQDAKQVGPIRSGRFFDANIIQMYKGVFVYGSAYEDVQRRFFNSDFYNRLVLEQSNSCPALCRYDPNGQNMLVSDTSALTGYLKTFNMDNTRQNLDGMFFKMQAPAGGEEAEKVYVRFSAAIYNRWDYDKESGRYLRFSDAENDFTQKNEIYAQLTDRLTDQPIAAENVVTMCVPHSYYDRREDIEVMDIHMSAREVPQYVSACDGKTYPGNKGPAYIARDGQLYKVTWVRESTDSVLTLVNEDGTLFPFKPGQTWFEVLGASSEVKEVEGGFRFVHHMVP